MTGRRPCRERPGAGIRPGVVCRRSFQPTGTAPTSIRSTIPRLLRGLHHYWEWLPLAEGVVEWHSGSAGGCWQIRPRSTASVTACQFHTNAHVAFHTRGKCVVDFSAWVLNPRRISLRWHFRVIAAWRAFTRRVNADARRLTPSVGLRPCPRCANIAFRTRGKCVVDFSAWVLNPRRIFVRAQPPRYQRERLLRVRFAHAPERESDTLETRTKLTSHSALVLGGLPRLPAPFKLHEGQRRSQV